VVGSAHVGKFEEVAHGPVLPGKDKGLKNLQSASLTEAFLARRAYSVTRIIFFISFAHPKETKQRKGWFRLTSVP
jgi:hypothetical protein